MQMAAPFSNSHATQRMQFVIISHFPIPIDWNQPPADNRRHFPFSASMRRSLWIETEVGVKQSFIRTESRISETMENEVNSRKACQIANLRRLRWRELVLPNSIRFASVSSLSVFSHPRMEFFSLSRFLFACVRRYIVCLTGSHACPYVLFCHSLIVVVFVVQFILIRSGRIVDSLARIVFILLISLVDGTQSGFYCISHISILTRISSATT